MVSRLTGMEISVASLLDESSAAVEAMIMAFRKCKFKKTTFLVSKNAFDSTV